MLSALVYTVTVEDDPATTDIVPLLEAMSQKKACLLAVNKAIKLSESIMVSSIQFVSHIKRQVALACIYR